MKQNMVSVFLSLFLLFAGSCSEATPSPVGGVVVEDHTSLVAALQAAGAVVEIGDPIIQTFFDPEGRVIKVNGQDVQVFEYESNEAMEAEAAQVKQNGGTIKNEMIMWTDVPHFYKTGRIIALYLGVDESLTSLFEKVMGRQFAGP
jgi:hypothetical protein